MECITLLQKNVSALSPLPPFLLPLAISPPPRLPLLVQSRASPHLQVLSARCLVLTASLVLLVSA